MNNQNEELTISVGGFKFDPLKEGTEFSKGAAIEEGPIDTSHHIIQFKKSLTRYERTRLKARYGLNLTEYILEFAYLEMIPADVLLKLEGDPLIRAIIPYQPAFKLGPGIGERSISSAKREEMNGLWLIAVLFPEANANQVVESLKSMGASEVVLNDDREIGGVLQVRFVLPSKDKLADIARIKEVKSIQEMSELKLDNGMTAGTIQSGSPGLTPVWNAGIHGENQIIGIIDNRVDINHCFFLDDNGNPVGPTHRKVVGFRAPAVDPVASHGTFVAGIAIGDDFNHHGTHAHRGLAWAARMTFSTIGNNTMFSMLQDAAGDGAVVHTNS
ncbi:MAG: S8 family serine peptidase, partial [Nitrososphaeraceae archaeon]